MSFFAKKTASRCGVTQAVAYTGTSAQAGSTFGSETYQVRLAASSACHFVIGNGTLTATTSSAYLPAGTVDYVIVSPGQSIAAVQDTAGGTLYVTEMS